MTIGDRVLFKMSEIGMSQKDFSANTGIAQSTISEWKSKRTNPTSEKIMIICKVLNVSPEWLLSGAENTGKRGNQSEWLVIDKESESGEIMSIYNRMNPDQRARLRGYMEAITSFLANEDKKS